MKTTLAKLMLTLLTVALLASCTGTGTNPEQTGDAGTTAATETATEAVDKTAEYESYLDGILAGYETVYNTETDGYPDAEDLLQNPDKYPEKMAVKVADMPGLAFTLSRDGLVEQIYAFGRENLSESISYRFFAGRMTVGCDTVLVNTESGANPAYRDGYYIITEPQTYYLSARDGDFTVSLQLDQESSAISYTKKHADYLGVEQSLLLWLSAYTGEDTVYEEHGTVSLEGSEAVLKCEKTLTLNEWYKSDGFGSVIASRSDWKEKRDLWGYDTFIEFLFRYINENEELDSADLSSYKHLLTDMRKIDITAEENIPFRLTDMTFAEIEAEFGPLTREYVAMGGSPVYVSDKLPGIEIMFLSGSTVADGLPAASGDDIPDNITILDDRALYPGIKPGMTADEVAAIIPEMDPKGGFYSIAEYLGGYRTSYGIEGYSISVAWELPKETYSELEQNLMENKTAEEYFDTHEFNGTVAGFKIF